MVIRRVAVTPWVCIIFNNNSTVRSQLFRLYYGCHTSRYRSDDIFQGIRLVFLLKSLFWLELFIMCFRYIIKLNFVAKTWTRSVDFILLFAVFICLAGVVVGFGYFSVVNHLAEWYGTVMRSRAAWNYFRQSDSSIQRPRSISKNI